MEGWALKWKRMHPACSSHNYKCQSVLRSLRTNTASLHTIRIKAKQMNTCVVWQRQSHHRPNAHCAKDKLVCFAWIAGSSSNSTMSVGCRHICERKRIRVWDWRTMRQRRFTGTMMTSYIIFALIRLFHDEKKKKKNRTGNAMPRCWCWMTTTMTAMMMKINKVTKHALIACWAVIYYIMMPLPPSPSTFATTQA